MRMLTYIRGEFAMLCHLKERSELLMLPINSLKECRFFMEKNEKKQKRLPSKYLFFNMLGSLNRLPTRHVSMKHFNWLKGPRYSQHVTWGIPAAANFNWLKGPRYSQRQIASNPSAVNFNWLKGPRYSQPAPILFVHLAYFNWLKGPRYSQPLTNVYHL